MCNQALSKKSFDSENASGNFSIIRLIWRWLAQTAPDRRKVLRTSDLSPDLLRDIGLEDTRHQTGSLEENWRRELDHLSRWN